MKVMEFPHNDTPKATRPSWENNTMVATIQRFTAGQTILLAAEEMTHNGIDEFNEWELTVASWQRDPSRFGLRGFEDEHPDHKRVMNEIMGKKPNNPVQMQYIAKVRPNTYVLTSLGKAEAKRLRTGSSSKAIREPDPHDRLVWYTEHPAFHQWQNNPAMPDDWEVVANFLNHCGEMIDIDDPIESIRRVIRTSLDWCQERDVVWIEPSRKDGDAIHVRELAELNDFLQALEYRFPEKMRTNAPSNQ